MELNADFTKRVIVRPEDNEWVPSPMPGVDRMMLDRIGDEVARATTIVRYAPDSKFSAHTHDGGEEFIVLDGVFEDEHGAFPAGSYIRNPPTSSHTPGSAEGTVIFVKLWQFDPDDRSHVRIDTNKLGAVADKSKPGVAVSPLFKDTREDVRLETWASGASGRIIAAGGAELLVLNGSVIVDGDTYAPWTWVRLPDGDTLNLTAGQDGARLWIKTGHLVHAAAPAV